MQKPAANTFKTLQEEVSSTFASSLTLFHSTAAEPRIESAAIIAETKNACVSALL